MPGTPAAAQDTRTWLFARSGTGRDPLRASWTEEESLGTGWAGTSPVMTGGPSCPCRVTAAPDSPSGSDPVLPILKLRVCASGPPRPARRSIVSWPINQAGRARFAPARPRACVCAVCRWLVCECVNVRDVQGPSTSERPGPSEFLVNRSQTGQIKNLFSPTHGRLNRSGGNFPRSLPLGRHGPAPDRRFQSRRADGREQGLKWPGH